MIKRDMARYDAGTRVQEFNEKFALELDTIDEYADEESSLDGIIAQIEAAITVQATDNRGVGQNKMNLRVAMGKLIVQYASRGVVKAKRAGNTELAVELGRPERYFILGTADEGISRANAMIKLINANLALLTNISAANVADMTAAVGAFAAVKDVPVSLRQTKKVMGTNQLPKLLAAMDVCIDNMGKLIQSYFGGSVMAAEFVKASKLIILGVRHTGVMLVLVDAATGAVIANGKVATTNGKKREVAADEKGVAVFNRIRNGNRVFMVSAGGYETQVVAVKVVQGRHAEVVVKMSRS